jgi:hypothetical protein
MIPSLCCYEQAQLAIVTVMTAFSTGQIAPAASAVTAAAPSSSRVLLLLLLQQTMPQAWCVHGAGRLDTTLAAAARCSAAHAASTDMWMCSVSCWHAQDAARYIIK